MMSIDVISKIESSTSFRPHPNQTVWILLPKPLPSDNNYNKLKKSNLDRSELNNYRLISNLPFLGKVLEKVFIQLLFHLTNNGILEKYSTETALLKVVNDLRNIVDHNNVAVILFNTVDYDIVIDRLKKQVGFSDHVLAWFQSYLTEQQFSVSLGSYVSETHGIEYDIPQGSILGPILFSL